MSVVQVFARTCWLQKCLYLSQSIAAIQLMMRFIKEKADCAIEINKQKVFTKQVNWLSDVSAQPLPPFLLLAAFSHPSLTFHSLFHIASSLPLFPLTSASLTSLTPSSHLSFCLLPYLPPCFLLPLLIPGPTPLSQLAKAEGYYRKDKQGFK